MKENEPSSDPPALDYAIPPARRGQPIFGAFVALLAAMAGLFGALMLFYGIPAIPYVLFHDNIRDFSGDLFQIIMFLLIGCFCLYIAIRWSRAVGRIISGR